MEAKITIQQMNDLAIMIGRIMSFCVHVRINITENITFAFDEK